MVTRQKITEAAVLKRPNIKRPRHRNTQAHHENNNSAKKKHDHRKNGRERKTTKSRGWTRNNKDEKRKRGGGEEAAPDPLAIKKLGCGGIHSAKAARRSVFPTGLIKGATNRATG